MRTARPHPRWLPAAALVMGTTLLAPAALGAPTTDRGRGPDDARAGAEMRRPLLRHRPGVLDLVARTIGIERAELVAQLRQGRSIAEIARNHGTDPGAVVDALVDAASKRIDTAVARGRLDADRAEQLKAKLPERARKLVEREPRARDSAVRAGRGR